MNNKGRSWELGTKERFGKGFIPKRKDLVREDYEGVVWDEGF
jgi:hypothetical protein